MSDQATQLRLLMKQVAARQGGGREAGRVVAVTSGKGGVGKTNISVNLAARLARMGRKVVLLDADMGLANADVLCGISARTNLAHVIAGRRSLEDAMVAGPGGFRLIPGASGLATMAALSEFERAHLIEQLRRATAGADLVLIDTGAGISPNVLTFAAAADELLVVTTPEPTAIVDAYGLIKALNRKRERLKVNLLMNMVVDRHEAKRVFDRLDITCRRFLGLALTDAGHVVHDPRVPIAVRRRAAFVIDSPQCPASLCIGQLSHKMDQFASQPHDTGFFRRVASWLAG